MRTPLLRPIAATRTFAALALLIAIAPARSAHAQNTTAAIPDSLSDAEFKQLIVSASEPNGYFRSENLLSNETGYQYVIQPLLAAPRSGQVYLGVGPEQNFTYIKALQPKIAIIFDIRRGNLLEHMLYRALFELSADRGEFFSRLFSKPRPAGIDSTTTADSLMNAFWDVRTDSVLYRKNKSDVVNLLTKKHDFGLSADDISNLLWVYDQFYQFGPSITYSMSSTNGYGGGMGRGMPTYADLVVARDGAGSNRGFLATEAGWRSLRKMETHNLIVPVVGDFAGPRAIRTVGQWLKDHNAKVTAFYASNVEQYLWQDGKAGTYYDNVATLPLDSTAVFIRSSGGRAYGMGPGGGMRAPNLLCSIPELLDQHRKGLVVDYGTVLRMCN